MEESTSELEKLQKCVECKYVGKAEYDIRLVLWNKRFKIVAACAGCDIFIYQYYDKFELRFSFSIPNLILSMEWIRDGTFLAIMSIHNFMYLFQMDATHHSKLDAKNLKEFKLSKLLAEDGMLLKNNLNLKSLWLDLGEQKIKSHLYHFTDSLDELHCNLMKQMTSKLLPNVQKDINKLAEKLEEPFYSTISFKEPIRDSLLFVTYKNNLTIFLNGKLKIVTIPIITKIEGIEPIESGEINYGYLDQYVDGNVKMIMDKKNYCLNILSFNIEEKIVSIESIELKKLIEKMDKISLLNSLTNELHYHINIFDLVRRKYLELIFDNCKGASFEAWEEYEKQLSWAYGCRLPLLRLLLRGKATEDFLDFLISIMCHSKFDGRKFEEILYASLNAIQNILNPTIRNGTLTIERIKGIIEGSFGIKDRTMWLDHLTHLQDKLNEFSLINRQYNHIIEKRMHDFSLFYLFINHSLYKYTEMCKDLNGIKSDTSFSYMDVDDVEDDNFEETTPSRSRSNAKRVKKKNKLFTGPPQVKMLMSYEHVVERERLTLKEIICEWFPLSENAHVDPLTQYWSHDIFDEIKNLFKVVNGLPQNLNYFKNVYHRHMKEYPLNLVNRLPHTLNVNIINDVQINDQILIVNFKKHIDVLNYESLGDIADVKESLADMEKSNKKEIDEKEDENVTDEIEEDSLENEMNISEKEDEIENNEEKENSEEEVKDEIERSESENRKLFENKQIDMKNDWKNYENKLPIEKELNEETDVEMKESTENKEKKEDIEMVEEKMKIEEKKEMKRNNLFFLYNVTNGKRLLLNIQLLEKSQISHFAIDHHLLHLYKRRCRKDFLISLDYHQLIEKPKFNDLFIYQIFLDDHFQEIDKIEEIKYNLELSLPTLRHRPRSHLYRSSSLIFNSILLQDSITYEIVEAAYEILPKLFNISDDVDATKIRIKRKNPEFIDNFIIFFQNRERLYGDSKPTDPLVTTTNIVTLSLPQLEKKDNEELQNF
ncbi:hypothetical protein SNEBB_009549 [Seison nebaliae]|nr:hypothetical protein SNEBB_009549 [Seison nebaliae]